MDSLTLRQDPSLPLLFPMNPSSCGAPLPLATSPGWQLLFTQVFSSLKWGPTEKHPGAFQPRLLRSHKKILIRSMGCCFSIMCDGHMDVVCAYRALQILCGFLKSLILYAGNLALPAFLEDQQALRGLAGMPGQSTKLQLQLPE